MEGGATEGPFFMVLVFLCQFLLFHDCRKSSGRSSTLPFSSLPCPIITVYGFHTSVHVCTDPIVGVSSFPVALAS